MITWRQIQHKSTVRRPCPDRIVFCCVLSIHLAQGSGNIIVHTIVTLRGIIAYWMNRLLQIPGPNSRFSSKLVSHQGFDLGNKPQEHFRFSGGPEVHFFQNRFRWICRERPQTGVSRPQSGVSILNGILDKCHILFSSGVSRPQSGVSILKGILGNILRNGHVWAGVPCILM